MVPFQVRKYGPEHELRLGWASWDEDRTHISVKYTWFDKRGHACRGGEVPIKALPQMLAMAIQSGHLSADNVPENDVSLIAEFFAVAKNKISHAA
jgi:hypothetical protein